MACGGAVVASAVGALPEVAGDGAVIVDTHDVDAWSDALRAALADDNDDLRRRGGVAASALSWKATADATLALYGVHR